MAEFSSPELLALIERSQERGWVTVDELNQALPQERLTPEEIEAGMHRLAELEIDVVDK